MLQVADFGGIFIFESFAYFSNFSIINVVPLRNF